MKEDQIHLAVQSALGKPPISIERISGGANNVVARVETSEGSLLAKIYFKHKDDPRDRLGTEYRMLRFLRENDVSFVPRPIAMSREHSIGLYEFIDGEKPIQGQIHWEDARQLGSLLEAMWRLRSKSDARTLPNASEAKFSIGAYLDHLGTRLQRTEQALSLPGSDGDADAFVRSRVRPAYDHIGEFVQDRAETYRLDPAKDLAEGSRTLSPADHGFHNSLRTESGRLVFVDFEYAGWDEPAQMLANACLQPEVPLPAGFRKPFIKEMLQCLHSYPLLIYRLRILYPMLALKWSLIMLNEFMPVSAERRSFAGSNPSERRRGQLDKAGEQVEVAIGAASEGFFLDELIDERND